MVSNLKTKKGTLGTAVLYCTRNQALARLQLRLPEFRRLCILKGVHPREPRRKLAGQNKTYYHVKDVAFLQHEPLLAAFRAQRVHAKKVRRAKAKSHAAGAARLEAQAPSYTLDALVRERYPSFGDALRDLGDPLTLVHLFAVLPAERAHRIAPERVQAAKSLSVEFQAYVALTGSLRKTFVSVKGIYFQAAVCGESVTWLVPHGLSQLLPSDVDYRVMLTFLEFDESLLRFVNFRLFHSLGLPYPPPMEHSLLDAGAPPVIAATAAVGASVGAHEQQADDGLLLGSDADGAHSRADDDGSRGHLFRGLVFFLARETTVHALSFVIRACGGRCGWAGPGSPLGSDDAAITHRVVDRPQQQGADALAEHGACSVQPQWVFDSLNFGICCPTQPYAPGQPLPPHLSPFVQPTTDGGYAPEFLDTVADWQAAARGHARLTERSQPKGRGAAAGRSVEQSDEQLYSQQLAAEFRGAAFSGAARGGAGTGLPPLAPSTEDDVEAAGLSAALLPRKKKELFKAMQMGIAASNAKAERLRGRKEKLSSGRE